jgi:hypothetical protein
MTVAGQLYFTAIIQCIASRRQVTVHKWWVGKDLEAAVSSDSTGETEENHDDPHKSKMLLLHQSPTHVPVEQRSSITLPVYWAYCFQILDGLIVSSSFNHELVLSCLILLLSRSCSFAMFNDLKRRAHGSILADVKMNKAQSSNKSHILGIWMSCV